MTPKQSFNNAYVEELYEMKNICTSTKKLCIILDDKLKKINLNKVKNINTIIL